MMDEDSILFQAMKSEMMPPAIDTVSMRMTDPNNPYPIGVETRTKSPGGPISNPLRMQQQPTDFAGRPARANDNPNRIYGDSALGRNEMPMRPSGNVINQYQPQFEQQRMYNMINQEIAKGQGPAAAEIRSNVPGMSQRVLDKIREFFNANRKPDWLD